MAPDDDHRPQDKKVRPKLRRRKTLLQLSFAFTRLPQADLNLCHLANITCQLSCTRPTSFHCWSSLGTAVGPAEQGVEVQLGRGTPRPAGRQPWLAANPLGLLVPGTRDSRLKGAQFVRIDAMWQLGVILHCLGILDADLLGEGRTSPRKCTLLHINRASPC